MNGEVGGCRPAATILGVVNTDCDQCPFPFCVVAEASIIRVELREHVARIMRRLGSTVEETAAAMEVSIRSIYRYADAYVNVACTQCNLLHSQDVMCKSNTYSVVHISEQYTIVLNKHRHATPQELKTVEYFIDYVFPSSIAEKSTNSHDFWVLSRVELEEAKSFQGMCDALNTYTLSLDRSRGERCLQTVR